jgi:hypothetical protein
MARPGLILFDDRIGRDWMPFTLTRPAGELLFGTFTLRERAERVLGLSCLGHLAADHLADFDEHDAPGVLRLADLPPTAALSSSPPAPRSNGSRLRRSTRTPRSSPSATTSAGGMHRRAPSSRPPVSSTTPVGVPRKGYASFPSMAP